MREYAKQNFTLILWMLLFIAAHILLPGQYSIYLNFVYYTGLLVYFIVKKEFSLRQWKESITSGKIFWKNVILAVLFIAIAFALTTCLEMIFPGLDTGKMKLKITSFAGLIVFAASTIILPPIAEELFFRKRLIRFENKKIFVLTTLFSMFLFALEHAIMPWGIFLIMIWALPMSLFYIKTKNIYVTMTAHLITNLVVNGADTIFMAIKLIQS
jgi:membrane protease YdiL (CAAX protease family)